MLRNDAHDRRLLWAVLTLDLLLIGLAWLGDRGVISDSRVSLAEERGIPEIAQYLKLAGAALLLYRRALARVETTSFLWGSLFVVLLIDDAFEGHERAGVRLSTLLSLPPIGNMRANQVGELIAAGAMAATFLAALAWTWRSASPSGRALSAAFIGPLLLLGTFGVLVDATHSLIRGQAFAPILGYVEDGGELIAATLLLWVAWRTGVHARAD